jgi:hypothetical protein
MSTDIWKEVELAIKYIISSSYTRYIYLRADKLKRANPRLRRVYVSYIGKIMNQVLHEYEGKGLIRILGIKRNHVTKFYVEVLDSTMLKRLREKRRMRNG